MNLANNITKLGRTQTHKSAIEIDFPNMHIGLKKSDWPLPFDYEIIEGFALKFGTIHSSRIYADCKDYVPEKKILSQFDTELINADHIFVRGEKRKDLVDTQMAYNIGMLICENQEINLIIICSGDADFIPVIKSIKAHANKKVIVIAPKYSMSEYLGTFADFTINYEFIAKLY